MTELLTAAEMRAIERAAMEAGEVSGLDLMERAGQGVVEAVMAWRPALAEGAHRALVLCGPGNNGGDGLVVARLLRLRGWDVSLSLYGDPDRLKPDPATMLARWRALGGGVDAWDDAALEDRLDAKGDDLVVDALFGTGLTRAMPDDMTRLWHGFMPGVHVDPVPRIVAVDLPSGICSDSGANLEGALPANLTVSFHRPKLGHYLTGSRALGGGALWCGALRVVDIGLSPRAHRAGLGDGAPVVRAARPAPALAKRPGHKYDHGHALILSGGVGKGGAARLAARGALRIGAGLVTVGCPPSAVLEHAARLDAVMVAPVVDAGALMATVAARKIASVCIGPGFGTGARLRAFVEAVLEGHGSGDTASGGAERDAAAGGKPLPVVLDADALTTFSQDPERLFARLHAGCVLTPHDGEFGRLFPDILARLRAPADRGPAFSKVDAAREAAARAGCTVLLKGPDTVIAAPDGRCTVNAAVYERAAPWLATAGSGDVLAGMIAGLLARGLDPLEAAGTAAWCHVEAARAFGPGLVAEDLPETLPRVMRTLGL